MENLARRGVETLRAPGKSSGFDDPLGFKETTNGNQVAWLLGSSRGAHSNILCVNPHYVGDQGIPRYMAYGIWGVYSKEQYVVVLHPRVRRKIMLSDTEEAKCAATPAVAATKYSFVHDS